MTTSSIIVWFLLTYNGAAIPMADKNVCMRAATAIFSTAECVNIMTGEVVK